MQGTVNATAASTDTNLSSIQFLMDGNLLGSAIDKNAATYSINTLSGLPDGAHTLGIQALDLAGGAGVDRMHGLMREGRQVPVLYSTLDS